ncbi:MAG: UvrB/UvrC motif-containing protein [Candidatus Latescibacterota bacterium]|nr:UvrB/UvrC motif-containing protein [Candidatus Latescibacterota bacterium]
MDITDLLESWDYEPDSNVRKVKGTDGIAKIQVRVDQGAFQGILQLNLDGRPDGKRPHDCDFALDHYRSSLQGHRSHRGTDRGFELDHDSCEELFDESARVYGRYVFLFQIKEYERVIRDTQRNMDLFRFVNAYAAHAEDRENLEKWWPYVLRIHATAKSMLAVQEEEFDDAVKIIADAREEIEGLELVEAEEFFTEQTRSLEALDELVEELSGRRPLNEREQLEQELREAIDSENFEQAAELRDRLNDMAS